MKTKEAYYASCLSCVNRCDVYNFFAKKEGCFMQHTAQDVFDLLGPRCREYRSAFENPPVKALSSVTIAPKKEDTSLSARNESLFKIAVFLKSKYGNNWHSKLRATNDRMHYHLPDKEIEDIIRSLEKREFIYVGE